MPDESTQIANADINIVLNMKKDKKGGGKKRAVVCIDETGKELYWFESTTYAGKTLEINSNGIGDVCRDDKPMTSTGMR